MRNSSPRSPRTTIQLRAWQQEAFGVYRDAVTRGERSILWEATPGAGKTTAALAVCLHQHRRLRTPTILVIVPTAHLKIQWARAAGAVGLNLEISITKDGAPRDRETHGYVVTYQQIAQDPSFFRTIARQSCTVLDEVHHAGDGLSWGDAILFTLAEARFVLCLSGTPFRSDNAAIPFVRYDESGVSSADYAYGYSRAVEEGVCRPTAFLTYGGEVSWRDDGGEVVAAFSDPLDPVASARRLRAAVSAESGWMTPLLRDAHRLLLATREQNPHAGGLVVTANQSQARKLSRALASITGEKPVLVLSEDSDAAENLKRYTESSEPWLVACNMVSEGVDIPRLQVGVYATTVRTKMYFRQFIGRLVRTRYHPHRSEKSVAAIAYCYLPADPTLKQLAYDIESEIKHCIDHRDREGVREDFTERPERSEPIASLWEVLESTNDGLQSVIVHGAVVNGSKVSSGTILPVEGTLGNSCSLLPIPTHPLTSSPGQGIDVQMLISEQVAERLTQKRAHTETKAALTREIRRLVALCHRRLNRSHATIYAQLNSHQGIQSQANCSENELQQRIALLNGMIAGSFG
jgi:superfamily II DNA or RNA helicase